MVLLHTGIQREQFLCFLSLLETRCPIHELKSPVDWRRQRRSALAAEHARTNVSWFLEANQEEFEKEVKELIGNKQGEWPVIRQDYRLIVCTRHQRLIESVWTTSSRSLADRRRDRSLYFRIAMFCRAWTSRLHIDSEPLSHYHH